MRIKEQTTLNIEDVQKQFEKVIRLYFDDLFQEFFLEKNKQDNKTYTCENTEASWIGYLLCVEANALDKLLVIK